MQIKEGDKVRVIDNKSGGCHPVGHIGYAYRIGRSACRVSCINGEECECNYYIFDDLKLVDADQSDPEDTLAALAKKHGILITATSGEVTISYDGRST